MSVHDATMNDAAGAEEHQRFEKRVRHHVKDADHKRAHAAGHEHEAQLGNGGVGQNFLDVVLRDANRCGKQRGSGSNQSNDHHHGLRVLEDNVGARHHVESGRHHGRGVDQRRNRCWPGHRIRQPHVQRQCADLPRRR